MKFSVALQEFQSLLQSVSPAVPPRSTLPVLENFHVTQEGNELRVVATDQELTIISSIEVLGEGEGDVLMPARKLLDIVKALGTTGSIAVEVDLASYRITLKTDFGEYVLVGLESSEFPEVPDFETGEEITFAAEDISKIANKAVYAVSKDEYRPAMTGVLFQFNIDSFNAVSTDSYRLVRVCLPQSDKTRLPAEQREAIIPARTIDLLKKADHDVLLMLSDTHAKFILDDRTIITRIIDEKFPAYEAVIPYDNDKLLKFRPSEAITAIRRVSLFSSAVSRQVQFVVEPNSWKIVAHDFESGNQAEESVACEYDNEAVEIAFNYRYVEEVLAHITDSPADEALMIFSTPTRAVLMKPLEDGKEREDLLMLVMPARPLNA